MAPAKPSSLSRAAAIGLSAGVALAGVALMVLALRTLGRDVDCSGPDANQCFFELGLEHDLARWQLGMGIALELIALGALLWIRAQDRKAARTPDEPSA